MFDKIEQEIQRFKDIEIGQERKEKLQPLIDYIRKKQITNTATNLNFICTHNSRRSHFAQIWGQTLAYYFGIPNVNCYSGGTETTRISPTVLDTFGNIGFQTQQLSESENPVFAVKFAQNAPTIIAFSKEFSNSFNPQSQFAAVITCSQADEGCPFVAGSEKRIAIPYEDPKVSDGTPLQEKKYAETLQIIGSELYYVFSKI